MLYKHVPFLIKNDNITTALSLHRQIDKLLYLLAYV